MGDAPSRFAPDLVVREAQRNVRLYPPQYDLFETVCSSCAPAGGIVGQTRSNGGMRAEDAFSIVVEEFGVIPGVTVPDRTGKRTFGSTALKINGSIFAMLSEGRLVVKLPAQRVGELIAERTGEPFDGGKGKPMREWLAVSGLDSDVWCSLAREASEFVSSRTR